MKNLCAEVGTQKYTFVYTLQYIALLTLAG